MEARLISRFKQLMVPLFLLSVIAWIVNGLVANETVTTSAFPLTIDLSSLADSFQYAAFFMLLAMSAGALTVLILDRRIGIDTIKALISRLGVSVKHANSRRKFISTVVAYTIVLIAILLVLRLKLGNLVSTGNQQSPTTLPQLSAPTTTFTTTLTPQIPFTFLFAFGIILLAIMFVGGLMLVQAMRETREEAKALLKEDDVLKEKAVNVVKETISSIIHEGDFRAAIIRCYQRLCELLARYNCQIQDHETVQEFRMSASKILNIPEKPFGALTVLFEEARYSLHEIDEAKRNDALRFLTEIRDHLSSGS